jgi:hypothetical protein
MIDISRRALVFGGIFVLLTGAAAHADDGGGGNSGGGDSGGGGGNSGGEGNGSDDNGGSDDDDSSSGSGNRSGRNGGGSLRDQDRVRRAVQDGSAVSLKKLKEFLNVNYPGKIINLNLEKKPDCYVYHVRILQAGNRVKNLTVDALTLQRKTK